MDIAIYGAGPFGRNLLTACQADPEVEDILFIVDEAPIGVVMVRGCPVVASAALMAGEHGVRRIVLALEDGVARRRAAARFAAAGYRFHTVAAQTKVVRGFSETGDGTIFQDHTLVGPNVRIGAHFLCERFSSIAPASYLGDFVTFASNVRCGPGVTIGDDVYVGSSAVLRAGVTIGEGAYICAGADVTGDVAPGALVIGDPTRVKAA
ncbi:MAG: hypothetical protein K9H25_11410 [Rhodospirillum sp.]|nr:hypothetical protein [Rhodospirillum sp.]MCF8489838.1 hypothetical protein [Rhodospirillum sp.]MCF8499667.1 hypothetical protein [Rhodospirillum sp.]